MATYEVKPPEEVWQNINKQRSFGHVTTNRIMQGFFMGLLAVLLGFGAYFSYSGNTPEGKYQPLLRNGIEKSALEYDKNEEVLFLTTSFADDNQIEPQEAIAEKTGEKLPSQDLTASLNAMMLNLDPDLFADKSLQRLLNTVEDISLVKPFELVRYEHLNKINRKDSNPFDFRDQQTLRDNYWTQFPLYEKKNQFSLLLTFSPEFINKNFHLKNFLPAGYIDQRRNFIRSRRAFTFSGRADYYFGKHAFLEFGLDWTKISETSEINGSVLTSNFSFFSVPVLFGHEYRFNRIAWELKAGLGYQFYNSYNGKIIGADGIRIIDFNEPADNPYRNSGVFNLHVASGISYLYSENIRFILEPYYKRSINSVTERKSPFTEKIEYMGIAVGAKMDL